MKQLLLALGLITAPVLIFFVFVAGAFAPPTSSSALGDLTALGGIAADVSTLIGKGDLAAAETRATDLETAWDDAEPTLRPQDPAAWAAVDDAADALFHALRASTPDAAGAATAAASLIATLENPVPAAGSTGSVLQVAGIDVTDATGHALPCEAMLVQLTDALAASPQADDIMAQVADLQTKATERCNADDDTRSDSFSAQALSLLAD